METIVGAITQLFSLAIVGWVFIVLALIWLAEKVLTSRTAMLTLIQVFLTIAALFVALVLTPGSDPTDLLTVIGWLLGLWRLEGGKKVPPPPRLRALPPGTGRLRRRRR